MVELLCCIELYSILGVKQLQTNLQQPITSNCMFAILRRMHHNSVGSTGPMDQTRPQGAFVEETKDFDGASTSSWSGAIHSDILKKVSKRPKYSRFTQQELPACKPLLTPWRVVAIFMIVGVIFIPIGVMALRASQNVVEIRDEYDIECIPNEFRSDKVAYITNDTISKSCTRSLIVSKHMKPPVYAYYQLTNYYQNHRRYVKSRSDSQLLHGLKYNGTSSCKPEQYSNGLPIVPCGLIAWSFFNDTYTLFRSNVQLNVNKKNIAWKSDREHKFGKNVYPYNFQNGSFIGGGKLDPSIPLSEQEDLIVWMRTAALSGFRKLYGRIEVDLYAGDEITVLVENNYNTYSFGGTKSFVLSTTSGLGGKNDFLGIAYLTAGIFCFILAAAFFLLHIKKPRPLGDPAYLSWNKTNTLDSQIH
eukprot:Gb_01714 [translate_table: standard]